MNRMATRLVAAIVLAIGPTAATAATTAAGRPPNVVVIVADDLGYGDIGAQGESKDVRTPNIDAVGAAGVRFTQGYVSAPVCSPSRCGLLTGRYQERCGFEANAPPGFDQQHGLPPGQTLLADVLKRHGYATGALGKWHLGLRPECRPQRHGFDEFFGFLGGMHRYLDMPPAARRGENAIRRGDAPVDEPDYLTDAITREAVSFIDRHRAGPFFLYVAYNAVHVPLQVPARYTKPYEYVQPPKRKLMDGMLAAEDAGVGRIRGQLRAAGLDGDTLVVFLSDNGGPTAENQSRNAPLRGFKGQIYEGGIRVPFMLAWPGHVPPGRVLDQPIISLDVFPTALAAAGVPVTPAMSLDGVDLLPLIEGRTADRPHPPLYWRFEPQWAIRDGDLKLCHGRDGQTRLFDLAKDVSERTDLMATDAADATRLRSEYDAWARTLHDPPWPCKQEGQTDKEADGSEAAPDAG